MKFTLIADDNFKNPPYSLLGDYEAPPPSTKRTVEFEAVALENIVTEFELFLKGAGFVFGALDIIPQESVQYEEMAWPFPMSE
jgi:hypothetical protein